MAICMHAWHANSLTAVEGEKEGQGGGSERRKICFDRERWRGKKENSAAPWHAAGSLLRYGKTSRAPSVHACMHASCSARAHRHLSTADGCALVLLDLVLLDWWWLFAEVQFPLRDWMRAGWRLIWARASLGCGWTWLDGVNGNGYMLHARMAYAIVFLLLVPGTLHNGRELPA